MQALRLGSSYEVKPWPQVVPVQPAVHESRWVASQPLPLPLASTSLALPMPGSEPSLTAPKPLDSLTLNGLTITLADAARVAPVVYFHPDEQAWPCSAEDLLEGSKLIDANGELLVDNPTSAQLAQYRDASNRLLLDRSAYAGAGIQDNRIRAPMYVSAQVARAKTHVDLNYIFLFAFQPAQTARVLVPKNDFDCSLPHFGEHEGDVEGISVRLSPDLQTVWGVRYEAHGHEQWLKPSDVDFENGHPVVRCALNGHATYSSHGKPPLERQVTTRFKALGFGVEFIDMLSSEGPRWEPFVADAQGQAHPNGQLVFVGLQKDGEPINNQDWSAFAGRIGRHCENAYSGAGGIGKPLPKVQERYVNMIAKAAMAAGAVKGHYRDSNGTDGLGQRPWMRLEP